MYEWDAIGTLEQIPRQGSRVIETKEGKIAIFRTVDDQVFALRDRCPHAGGPLSQGIVHGRRVTCPLHNWVIELDTGNAVAPDQGQTACFQVEVRDGALWLRRPEAKE